MRAGHRAARAASTLHALLQERARAAVVAQSPLLHDACYLVARDEVDDFARRVATYGAEHPELDLVCTGPWAPASFAEAAA
jgi:DNA primase